MKMTEQERWFKRKNRYSRKIRWTWRIFYMSILLGVFSCGRVAFGADPYDNQLTLAEWNVAPQASRLGVAQAMVSAMKPDTASPMTYTMQLKMCVDAVAIEPRLGHLKLSDVAQSCAVELGWR